MEEQYLLTKLAKTTKAKKFLRGHFGDDDGILVSADRTPNLRGTLVTGFSSKYPTDNLSEISDAIDKKFINTLLVVGEDLFKSGLSPDQLKGISIIYIGTHENATSSMANVVLPSLTSFEKSGTFINRSFRLQKFKQAVPGPAGLLPDLHIIASLLNTLDQEKKQTSDIVSIWKQLSKSSTNPLYKIKYTDIPQDGIQLDSTRWSDLDFVEKKALHFSPSNLNKVTQN